MVAIPMFMMLRDVIKTLGKSIFVVYLVSILNFKMAAILDFKTPAIFNIFWPVSQLLSSLPRELKIVAIPLFTMLWDVIKAHGN